MATQAQAVSGNGAAAHALTKATIADDFWSDNAESIRESIRDVYAPKATDAQFLVFWAECKRRRAIPGKHIHFRLQKQKEKIWDDVLHQETERWTEKPIFITAIDFFRLTANRTGLYAGQKRPAWYYLDANNKPTIRLEIPDPQMKPFAAEAGVLRKDFAEPMVRIARYSAFVQTYRDGNPNPMWAKMGPEQLAKCAEAQALRAAFPEELGGLYTSEEIQGEESEPAPVAAQITSAIQPSLPPTIQNPETEIALPPAPVIDVQANASSSNGNPRTGGVVVSVGAVLETDKAVTVAPLEPEKKGVTVEDVQKRFGGEVLPARPADAKGSEGFKWYLRNVFDRSEVKVRDAGPKLQAFLFKAANAKTIKQVSDTQKDAILELLDKTMLRAGPAAVIEMVIKDSAK